MCRENPLWGAPRIHGELLKLKSIETDGLDVVSQGTSASLRPVASVAYDVTCPAGLTDGRCQV